MDTTLDISTSIDNARPQDNALTFVGFCTTQDRNIPVPNLICLLAHAFSSKAYSYLLSTSQIWEECYSSDELISLTNRLHSAWWAHPGSGKGFFTDDELNKAFEQYLILVCHKSLSALETTTIPNVGSSEQGRYRTVGRSEDRPPLSKGITCSRAHRVSVCFHRSCQNGKSKEASPNAICACPS